MRYFTIRRWSAAFCGVGLTAALFATTMGAADPMRAQAASAVRRALPLLQRSGETWLRRSNCTSCHHQSMGILAVKVAKDNGFRVDERLFRRQVTEANKRRDTTTDGMYELTGAINAVSGHGYHLLFQSALEMPPNDFTDGAGFYLTAMQTPKGFWSSSSHRPPIEDSPFTMTALAIRALRAYPYRWGGEAAVARGRKWLAQTPAPHSEARAMRLLGLYWSGAFMAAVSDARKAILREQRPDGGWSQMPGGASDAYATGQALLALRTAGGLPVTSPVYQAGARFLLASQKPDGSWRVPTRRVVSGLPYFETGYPHGVDQFVSYAGSAWAAMALSVYATDGNVRAFAASRTPAHRKAAPRWAKSAREQALFEAIVRGTAADVGGALRRGANPNVLSEGGTTPLSMAVRDPGKVGALLHAGALPNLSSKRGSMPLAVAAATRGGLPAMRLLLDAGADPNRGRSGTQEYPLLAAIYSLDRAKVDLLVQRGAEFKGESAMAIGSAETALDASLVRHLAALGASVNAADTTYGGTVLNNAVINRNAEAVQVLLKLGADPNVVDKEGFSPLQVAASGDPGDSRIVALLLAAGADPEHHTKNLPKALMLATRRGNRESARLLSQASFGRP